METFKAWKELIKAVKGISSAIEGENSKGGSGEVDNTNYLISLGNNSYGLINKNLDAAKLAFNIEEFQDIIPTKVGDLFTQEGVNIINSILSDEIIKNRSVQVCLFAKDSPEGNILSPIVTLRFINNANKYEILFNLNYAGYTSDKFTLDTPMSYGGIE